MFAYVKLGYRLVVNSIQTYLAKLQPEYVLKSAVSDRDVTAQLMAALAAGSVDHLRKQEKRVVVTYTYRNTGPYSYVLDDDNPSFPPSHKNDMAPPERQVVLAELGEDEDDVTEIVNRFGGPDGSFHGAFQLDLHAMFPGTEPGTELSLVYADGHAEILNF